MLIKLLSTIGGRIGKTFGIDGISSASSIAARILTQYLKTKSKTNINFNYSKRSAEIFEHYSLGKQITSLEKVRESYGSYIPLIFGTAKIYGTVIWLDKSKIVNKEAVIKGDGNECTHIYISVAFGLCEGVINRIGRVWHNDKLVDISKYKYRIYYGDESQEPDPLIRSLQSTEKYTPAFRGLAYIIFEDLDIRDFNNKVPILSFEVTRIPNLPSNIELTPNVAHIIKSIIMIPGTGEFVLDTKVQTKYINDNTPYRSLNCHNDSNIANSIVSLDELLNTCNNVQWVAPVVCWFGTDLEASKCMVLPKVEYHDDPPLWKVAHYSERNQAEIVSKDKLGNLRYGGTINDSSLLRYLSLLKSRNLKIMLYPIVMMDIEGKPWRGHISTKKNKEDVFQLAPNIAVANFFRGGNDYSADNPKLGSYNAFILHYAKLVQNKVDAFIIGSELKNLTSIYNSMATNDIEKFPAVVELINLAKAVKQILGNKVLVSYAADWSEYHHINTRDGLYYHLDTLWASQYIDFVGINAFFPLTNTQQSSPYSSEIQHGWHSGEGYDYYINNNQLHLFNNPAFAWKNIDYWWNNHHFNLDNQPTLWKPKMKPIWFTEFGFASIDKSTNQPNVFFDPHSQDGGLPKYSTGTVDFLIQARAIKATIEYWRNHADMIQNMFLWAWDARPRPGHTNDLCWYDQSLWEVTHRVNNKLNSVNLAAIIVELCHRSQLDTTKIDVCSIEEEVDGLAITQNHRIIDIITMLRNYYFFDIRISSSNELSFILRDRQPKLLVLSEECLSKFKQTSVIYKAIPQSKIFNSINFKFLNILDDYMVTSSSISKKYNNDISKVCNLRLPIITSLNSIQSIGYNILKHMHAENIIFNFVLPITYYHIRVTDILLLEVNNEKLTIRVNSIEYTKYAIVITAILHYKPHMLTSSNTHCKHDPTIT